ncbi:deaminase [Glycomyces niveus]|uniref:Bifunctional diaminohydroxyphosphoribosylaminopyrimidine deaminase/5-amino-6-(5-phosphoribosylamino)uracil reductase RibD n=1 Tax=Glycomyces niveus TaxID=2820287 RepID=A0ABS3U3W5_9ACTN|nr:bifunctional diaminohydroxyphosphoribosylaminopyrimidine deaminase/5-amino-6-(5-phosphoribosylamino)uracil reductase RibD [Glycomyces sp. NEAU-S30]MBO3732453.1 bifunctional diaminohydroxyphosphoribosylaminopyrimidine deaminase/5-amino-6-(5-phosphoribosylamino)uracil reductase RibD [Glycomyces sp. NEAU-S30]
MPNAEVYSTEDDACWMARAVALAERCPPSTTAFSVGAVLVKDGRAVGEGYSRAEEPSDHAEEVALRHAGDAARGATAYSSMEPCGHRASRPDPCARLLIAAGIARVVYALGEPLTFVDTPGGDAILRENGVVVAVMPEFADAAERPNAHLR